MMRNASSLKLKLKLKLLAAALLLAPTAGILDDFGAFFDTPGTVVQPPTNAPIAPIPPPTNAPIAPPPTNAPVLPPTNPPIDFHMDRVVPAVQAIEQEIRFLIAQDETMGPKFVRLAFHDCTGGCDGCVDMTFADNAGLHIPINALAPIVQRHESVELGISRADIWALASHLGADVAQARSGFKVDFHMKFIGRHNCEDLYSQCFDMHGNQRACTATLGPHVHLPEADVTTEEIFHFFFEEFGFDVQETVALMGAHTLGSLNRDHSGFDGPNGWVRDNLLLDHDYYIELIGGTTPDATMDELINGAPPWHRIRMNNNDIPGMPNKPAWRALPPDGNGGQEEILMLNADVSKTFD
jgi:hypothetical protein